MATGMARCTIVRCTVVVPLLLLVAGCGGEEPTPPPPPARPVRKAPPPPPVSPPEPEYVVIDDTPAEDPIEAPVPVDRFRVENARTIGLYTRRGRLGVGVQFRCTFLVSKLPRSVNFACEIRGPAGAVRELSRPTGEGNDEWAEYSTSHFVPRLDPRYGYTFRVMASVDGRGWTPVTPWGPVAMEVAN